MEQLRKDWSLRDIPVVILSAMERERIEERFSKSANDFIDKSKITYTKLQDLRQKNEDYGQQIEALKIRKIRLMEEKKGIAGPDRVKIVMTTALADKTNVIKASQHHCDCYLLKPLNKAKLLQELRNLKLNRPLGIWETC